MKLSLVCLVLAVLSGCGQAAVATKVEPISDSIAQKMVGDRWGNGWGEIEFGKDQYAGFVYDSTGVYGNLHGDTAFFGNIPSGIVVTFIPSKKISGEHPGHKAIAVREVFLSSFAMRGDVDLGQVSCNGGMPEGQFKWLGKGGVFTTQMAVFYNRTFWISWKAVGLEGPPADGEEVQILVAAMIKSEPVRSFVIDNGK